MSDQPSLCVVIPMKDPAQSKTRLGDSLPPKARAALARTLFRQTLRVLRSLDQDLHLVVVTNSPSIRAIAQPFGVSLLADPMCEEGGEGLNAAAQAGADHAARQGFGAVCVLPGDLADPSPQDMHMLFGYSRAFRSIIIAPAHDGGTNALIVTPPGALAFAYGPGSCAAHQAAAAKAGLSCLVTPLASLLYDVDRSSDLGAHLTRGLDRSLGAFKP